MIVPSGAGFKDDLQRYLARATTLIHAQETTDKIIAMLSGPDPVQQVARAAVMVMQRIDSASRQAGIEVQDVVKSYAAADIVNQLIELGQTAKKFRMDKDLAELALSVAVQDYVKGEIAAGRMNAKKVAVAAQADMRKLPPARRKEIQQTQARIMQTATRYKGGR